MSDGNTFFLLVRMALSLALVLGLLVFAARWVSRRQGLLTGRSTLQVPVTVLNRAPLTRNAHLHVVQVGSDLLVLGVTDRQVNLLGSLDPTDPALAPASQEAGDAAGGFASSRGPAPGASEPQDRSFFSSALGRVAAATALGQNAGTWQNQWRAPTPAQGDVPESRRGRHRG